MPMGPVGLELTGPNANPSAATANRLPARAAALLIPEAIPLLSFGEETNTVVVRGETLSVMPIPATVSPGKEVPPIADACSWSAEKQVAASDDGWPPGKQSAWSEAVDQSAGRPGAGAHDDGEGEQGGACRGGGIAVHLDEHIGQDESATFQGRIEQDGHGVRAGKAVIAKQREGQHRSPKVQFGGNKDQCRNAAKGTKS